jgi:hypothetical protein
LGECFTAFKETDLQLTLGGTVGSVDGNPKLIKRAIAKGKLSTHRKDCEDDDVDK